MDVESICTSINYKEQVVKFQFIKEFFWNNFALFE